MLSEIMKFIISPEAEEIKGFLSDCDQQASKHGLNLYVHDDMSQIERKIGKQADWPGFRSNAGLSGFWLEARDTNGTTIATSGGIAYGLAGLSLLNLIEYGGLYRGADNRFELKGHAKRVAPLVSGQSLGFSGNLWTSHKHRQSRASDFAVSTLPTVARCILRGIYNVDSLFFFVRVPDLPNLKERCGGETWADGITWHYADGKSAYLSLGIQSVAHLLATINQRWPIPMAEPEFQPTNGQTLASL